MSSGSSSSNNSWTLVDVPQDPLEAEREATKARLVESGIRIACAGFAGLCVGFSYSNKAAGAKIFQRSVAATGKKQRPPGAMPRLKAVQPANETNYPFMWGGSFVVFMAILETCRFWSPTSLALQGYQRSLLEDEEGNDNLLEAEWSQFALDFPGGPESLATIGDCTLGGSVAGLAVGFSKQRPPPSSSSTSPLQLPSSITKMGRRSLVLSGLGSGIALGMLAGVSIAGLRVAEAMAMEEVAKEEAVKSQEEMIEREAGEQRLKQKYEEKKDE